ncbi:hypothetical protein [Geodermatophilus marinus]|uniref:hypothetical protein n=1 Tax=Geodermatophilus sp. LHW52908 TaxID=2303986 RepID=UPI001F2E5B57|nr:hypothetical protein [Geodermatophilus sp. LHW52908]
MAKLSFLAGFGAGYVLGAKAGRERYEQIRRAWGNAKENPQLQEVAGMAQARADAVTNSVKARMGRDSSGSGSGSGGSSGGGSAGRGSLGDVPSSGTPSGTSPTTSGPTTTGPAGTPPMP